MAQYSRQLDGVFAALADPTRRSVIGQLGRGPASVSQLAQTTSMSLPSFMKHVAALEGSGLIHTSKSGRVRTCTLRRDRLAIVDGWLTGQRALWEAQTDRLEQFVVNPQEYS